MGVKTKIKPDGSINIGYSGNGFGIKAGISADEVRGSIGIGILEVEYNSNGGGKVGWMFGIYTMKVERVDCFYLKHFYIKSVYIYTEKQLVSEDCLEKQKDDEDEGRNGNNNDNSENNSEVDDNENQEVDIDLPFDLFEPDKIVVAFCDWAVIQKGNYLWAFPEFITISEARSNGNEIVLNAQLKTTTEVNDPSPGWPGYSTYEGNGYWVGDDYWRSGVKMVSTSTKIFTQGSTGEKTTENHNDEKIAYSTDFFSAATKNPFKLRVPIEASFNAISPYPPGILAGKWRYVFSYILTFKREKSYSRTFNGYEDRPGNGLFGAYSQSASLTSIRVFDGQGEIPPQPKFPPKEKKMKCDCRDIQKRLRRIEAVLATKELIDSKEKFQFPNHWLVYGGKGYTKASNYLQIANYQMRMVDHLSIHPFEIDIPDINPAKKGNQRVHEKYVNATAWAKAMGELLLENKTDSATQLNLIIRTAIILVRLYSTAIATHKSAIGILHFLGAPLKNKFSNFKFPFDITLGAREKIRGFGRLTPERIEREMEKHLKDLNRLEEEKTEASLQYFLKDTDQPVTYETYDRNQPNLIQRILGYGKTSSPEQ